MSSLSFTDVFDISVCIWTFFHRNLITSVTFPSSSTLVPCWFWRIPFSRSHFSRKGFLSVSALFPHIFITLTPGSRPVQPPSSTVGYRAAFFPPALRVFLPPRWDINDVERFTYSLSPAQIFLAEAGDTEPSQTFGRTTVPEQVLVAEMGNQIWVSSQRRGLALEINRLRHDLQLAVNSRLDLKISKVPSNESVCSCQTTKQADCLRSVYAICVIKIHPSNCRTSKTLGWVEELHPHRCHRVKINLELTKPKCEIVV